MDIAFRTVGLRKKFPLAISRGVSGDSENLFVSVTGDGITGWGEMAPGIREGATDAAAGQRALADFFIREVAGAPPTTPPAMQQLHARARECKVPPCALAALDIALWDWRARRDNLPLYQLLGFELPSAPTSVTIGINPPEVVRERVALLLSDGNKKNIRALKIKLGSREGLDADRAMFAEVVACARRYDVALRVDANGGWDVAQAQTMMKYLAGHGVEYVEQPLAEGCEDDLPALYHNRPLPVFVDESCRFAGDLPRWAHCVDGVNMKLMKCGGISGALDIIVAAKKFNLKTMIGCMSESSLSISAAAALTGGIDYIDLDSHLNLNPDPCAGAQLKNGIIMPNDLPGHGAGFVE